MYIQKNNKILHIQTAYDKYITWVQQNQIKYQNVKDFLPLR